MMPKRRTRQRNEKGQAAFELMMTMSLVFFLLFAMVHVSLICCTKLLTNYAAWSTARVWAVNKDRPRTKAEQALAHGCEHVVVYTRDDFVPTVMDVTDGEGCAVVYESIGKDTFARSLDCLRPMGMLASYGHASGAPDPVDVIELGARGSLILTRPAIMHYMAKRADLENGAAELFDAIERGAVKVERENL